MLLPQPHAASNVRPDDGDVIPAFVNTSLILWYSSFSLTLLPQELPLLPNLRLAFSP